MSNSNHHIKTLKILVGRYQGELLKVLICTAAAGALLILIPLWVKALVQIVLPASDLLLLTRHLLSGLLLALIIQVFLFAKDFIRLRLSHSLGADVRRQIFEKILSMPLSILQEKHSGDLISRLSNDITVFQDGLMKGIFRLIPNAVILLFPVSLMFLHSLLLSVITLFFIAPMAWTINYFVKKIRSRVKASQEQLALINNLGEESIRGVKEIKAFGREDQVKQRFSRRNRAALRAFVAQDRIIALNPVLVLMITVTSIAALIFLCTFMVTHGLLSMGRLISFLTCLALAFSPLQEIAHSFGFISRLYAVMDRFEEVLRIASEAQEGDRLPDLPEIAGFIDLSNINFSYDDGFALKDINLKIAAGETVAFVGPSGAGKTTLLNLLPLFLRPCSGTILIDNHDITKCNLESLRRQIGLVSQEPVLFDGTLMENLLFVKPGAGETEIFKAARAAHVDEFARKLPRAYHTRIGQYGSRLSVGQRQRIAIARALLVEPALLILDEPTSALDTESEHLIRNSLEFLCKNKTTLIVAHRMSTIRSADRVVVLNDGCIVETGPHKELLSRKGLYHKLFSYQDFH